MKKIMFSISILLMSVLCYAQETVFPSLTGPVIDSAEILTAEQAKTLTIKLLNFQKTKGSQITLCTVPTTSPLTIEEYGIKLGERWKIGRAGVDDGIIIIIAKNDRKMRIEVGYGLEHIITDLRAGRIIDYLMAPEFRKGDFYKGIDSSIDAVITYINGDDIPALAAYAPGTSSTNTDDTLSNIGFGLIFASIFLFIVLLAMGKTLLSILLVYFPFTAGLYLMGAGNVAESAIFGVFSMFPFAFIAVMVKTTSTVSSSGSLRSSSGYSSSSSSSYSSSSSSSSYSGGGGSFGGGGASGSW